MKLKGKERKAWYRAMILDRARRGLTQRFHERNRRHSGRPYLPPSF